MNKNDYGKAICKTFEKLTSERLPLEQTWKECFQYTYPMRGKAFSTKSMDGVMNAVAAKSDQAKLFDNTATDSVRLLASSVLSAMTPTHLKWFSLAIPNVKEDEIPVDARKWLEDASTMIWTNIHASNYDAQALEFFTDEMITGMNGLYIEPAKDGGYHFEAWPLHSMYCQDTLREEYIDTVYRQVNLTANEAINRFSKSGNIPKVVQEEFDKDPYSNKKFAFIHAIRPRIKAGKQSAGKLKKQQPWESIYVDKKSGDVVMESGYHEMPVIIPRWSRIPDSDYAFGPVENALADIKTLNKVAEIMLLNAEMVISGTYVAKDDGVFNPNTQKIGPRKVWMVSDTNNIKPLANGGDINFAVGEINRIQAQIRKVLLADQLGPTEKQNMTATEVSTRTNMIRQILGPIFSRLQSEFLKHLITRCFGIAFRAGELGQPPESLKQYGFHIVYRSPLAKAQKLQDIQSMDQFEAHLMQAVQINPALADNYDMDKATKKRAELLGIDVDLIREDKAIRQIRDDRSKANQQTQMAAMSQAQNNK